METFHLVHSKLSTLKGLLHNLCMFSCYLAILINIHDSLKSFSALPGNKPMALFLFRFILNFIGQCKICQVFVFRTKLIPQWPSNSVSTHI